MSINTDVNPCDCESYNIEKSNALNRSDQIIYELPSNITTMTAMDRYHLMSINRDVNPCDCESYNIREIKCLKQIISNNL